MYVCIVCRHMFAYMYVNVCVDFGIFLASE